MHVRSRVDRMSAQKTSTCAASLLRVPLTPVKPRLTAHPNFGPKGKDNVLLRHWRLFVWKSLLQGGQ